MNHDVFLSYAAADKATEQIIEAGYRKVLELIT